MCCEADGIKNAEVPMSFLVCLNFICSFWRACSIQGILEESCLSQLIFSHDIQLDRFASVVLFPELFRRVQPLLAEVRSPHLALVSLRDVMLFSHSLCSSGFPETSCSVTKSNLGEYFLY